MSQVPPQTNEGAVSDLMKRSLVAALRRRAMGVLEGADEPTVGQIRTVERLMRVALAVAGVGLSAMPKVQVHNASPASRPPGSVPELLSVDVTDLLAARASDHLHDALSGDPSALRAIAAEADRLIESEDIQLR